MATKGKAVAAVAGGKRKDPPQVSSDSSKTTGKWQQQPGGNANRAQKRVKLHEARAIRSQKSDAALNENGDLDLHAFCNSLEFSINALEDAMKSAKNANNTRAFQMVPRGMRRRNASHNVKRLPKRLRHRARHEQAMDNTPTITARTRRPRTTRAKIRAETAKKLGLLAERKRKRKEKEAAEKAARGASDGPPGKDAVQSRLPRPKIRRNALNEPAKPKSKFRKRQVNKTWLPTHLWHAKRARMTEPSKPLWRFALPLTPTDKVYRPTHRASQDHGAMIWDASYMSTIGLYGSESGIEKVLRAAGVSQEGAWNAKGRNWRAGSRSLTCRLSKDQDRRRRPIGPATIIWNPESSIQGGEGEGEIKSTTSERHLRQLFVRVHPASFLETFNELLRLVKMQKPQLFIEDLRYEIGSIELAGPNATEALRGVLHPYPSKGAEVNTHVALYQSLLGTTTPSQLPPAALLSFEVMDPRLRYPPRPFFPVDDESQQCKLMESLAKWPGDNTVESSLLFDRDARSKASQLPSQKTVSRRKAGVPPGRYLEAIPADPPIPIVLLAGRAGNSSQDSGTWTLLAPWKCIAVIWYSLAHYPLSSGGNPRFGGLDEQRQVAFERGLPWFPGDHLGTDAGLEWELEGRDKRKEDWDRRPKGKRVAWESLDLGAGRKGEVGRGWACDFEAIFDATTEDDQMPGQADNKQPPQTNIEAMDVDSTPDQKTSLPAATPHPLSTMTQLSKSSFSKLSARGNKDPAPARSIVTVRISTMAGGIPTPCARIYRLPSNSPPPPASIEAEVPATEPPHAPGTLPPNLRDQWLNKLPSATRQKPRGAAAVPHNKHMSAGASMETRMRLTAASLLAEPLPFPPERGNGSSMGGCHPLVPDAGDLVGFVTAGAFNLSGGRGTGIGSIVAGKVLDDVRAGQKGARLCIVRNAGEGVGWLAKWEAL